MDTPEAAAMSKFHFRLRVHLPGYQRIGFDGHELPLCSAGTYEVKVRALNSSTPVKEAGRLVLEGGPFPTEEAAAVAGRAARGALMRLTVKHRIGMDLGDGRASGGMSPYLKRKLAAEQGMTVLDDVHGLTVYDGAGNPKFVSASGSSMLTFTAQPLADTFRRAFTVGVRSPERVETSVALFSASLFNGGVQGRFLLLVMAVEALMQPTERSEAARDHVQRLIDETEQADLPPEEKASVVNSLHFLKRESINQTGRRLARSLPVGRLYAGVAPEKFFTRCYGLRSRLVHDGKVENERETLGGVVAPLSDFVADLLIRCLTPERAARGRSAVCDGRPARSAWPGGSRTVGWDRLSPYPPEASPWR